MFGRTDEPWHLNVSRSAHRLLAMTVGQIFSRESQAIFYNWKANPVQRMLDFDFLCGAPQRSPFHQSESLTWPIKHHLCAAQMPSDYITPDCK